MQLNKIASMLVAALAMFLFVLNVQAANVVARAVAAAATIAPEPEDPGVCHNRIPELDEFLAGYIPDQVLNMYAWVRSHPDYEVDKDNFVQIMANHFMHKTPDISSKCNVAQECEIISSCDNMKPANYPIGNRTEESQYGAYVILVSIQNFANYLNLLYRTFESLAVEFESQTEWMEATFTHNRENALVHKNFEHKLGRKYHWIGFAMQAYFGLGSALMCAAGPAGIPGMMMIMAYQTAIAEGLDQAYHHRWFEKRDGSDFSWNRTHPVKRALIPTGSAGDDVAAFLNPFGGLNAMNESNHMSPKHLFKWAALEGTGFESMAAGSGEIHAGDLRTKNSEVLMQTAKTILTFGNALFRGKSIQGPNNTTITLASIVATGNFLRPHSDPEAVGRILQTQLRASNLNTVWSAERIYIHVGNSHQGNCEMDENIQGPSVNRVCLAEYPDLVFRFIVHPRYQEDRHGSVASPDLPAGLDVLAGKGWEGINLESIARSAYEAWKQRGNEPMHTNIFADPDIWSDPQSEQHWTPSRPGIFDIAIFWDPPNDFVSSLNTKEGRQFPCEHRHPGPFEPVEDGPWQQQMASAKRAALFIDKTKLSTSADFKEGCDHHHLKFWQNDRQRCDAGNFNLSQWYNRTAPEEIDAKKHVKTNFINCQRQPGSAMKVGKTQCERGNCK